MKYAINVTYEQLNEAIELSKTYDLDWEFSDFFEPSVYENENKLEQIISGYQSIGRSFAKDTIHGAFLGLDLAASDTLLRERSRKLYRQSMDIAKRLGVKGVVFHTGLIGELGLDYYLNNWLTQSVSFWSEVCEDYPEQTIYMENSFEQNPLMLVELANKMSAFPNFKLCLDYGHAILSKTDIETWCRELAPYVSHMHLNDNDLKNDLHLAVGEGKIDFNEWRELLDKYNIAPQNCLIEMRDYAKVRKSLEYLKQYDNECLTQSEVGCLVQSDAEGLSQAEDRSPALSDNLNKNTHTDMLQQILDIGIALTNQKNPDKLLDTIINTAMDLTQSDAGTLYIVKDNTLVFKNMKTKSKGIDHGKDGEKIDLPPVPIKKENICAYAALTKQSLNIENVYESDLFDFSGPKKYDELNAYHTQSMIAIPMIDSKDEVIGVMQLINAMDDCGKVRPFTSQEEKILTSLASQTAIAMANMVYLGEINKLIWSFTEALTEAIDARTPYNGNHTRRVAEYAGLLVDYINEMHALGKDERSFTDEHKSQVVMAAFLHDIGKMITPISVMNKQTRLDKNLDTVLDRLDKIKLLLRVDMLENKIARDKYEAELLKVNTTLELIGEANGAGFLNDELFEKIKQISDYKYVSPDESVVIPFLTQKEQDCMQIRKGTLTAEERSIMEGHVVMTERILSKVYFNKEFAMAPIWAAQHHECINGTGYPKGISGDELGTEARILAVADICDALLATDRPYKKPMPKEKAFAIMESMAKEGKLEASLVEYLKQALEKRA